MRLLGATTGTAELYAVELGELWSGLALTLAQLDEVAADPEELEDDDVLYELRRLQHRLHTFGERVYGLTPPAGAEPSHAELTAALEDARDATGEIVEAVEERGAAAAERLLHEWRGTLFRVRLARLRVTAQSPKPVAEDSGPPLDLRAPLIAIGLVLTGTTLFVTGAVVGPWPVWVAGMLAVCGSMLAYRP